MSNRWTSIAQTIAALHHVNMVARLGGALSEMVGVSSPLHLSFLGSNCCSAKRPFAKQSSCLTAKPFRSS
jgi:hypothetical protein